MTLNEINEKFNHLEISEKRDMSDDYTELVFYTKDLDEWNKIFIDTLGPAIKPPGIKASDNDMALTRDYGGIQDNQTLFKKEFESVVIIAMLWPWQDNEHITLKMALLKE
ncbi:MAG: hypothetical protein KAS99_02930 [Candidatus Omnitrophica bacterium]|nr:hypothetical protein [Candidatus Omnitrophota bacterium]